jgi:hypothetical protein
MSAEPYRVIGSSTWSGAEGELLQRAHREITEALALGSEAFLELGCRTIDAV